MTAPTTAELAAASAVSAAAVASSGMSLLEHANALRSVLGDVSTVAVSQLVSLFQQNKKRPGFPALLKEAVPQIVLPLADSAAQITAQWYDDLAPDLKFNASPVVDIPTERIDKTIDWALYAPTTRQPSGLLFHEPDESTSNVAVWEDDPDIALGRLAGSAKRMVFDASRDTVVSNAMEEGVRWVRVAQPDACAFCRMLATRQDVYRTEADALTVQGRSISLTQADRKHIAAGLTTRDQALARRTTYSRGDRAGQAMGRALRGSRQYGESYHDHCRCTAAPVRGGVYEPPEYTQQWEQEYVDAVKAAKAAGKTKGQYGAIDFKAVLAQMRAADGGDSAGRHD